MHLDRRDCLGSLAAAGGLFALGGGLPGQAPAARRPGTHLQPPLPYALDALEPYMDAQTLGLHHGKHHAGYVAGLNKTELALATALESGDHSQVAGLLRQLAFHGSGHLLHCLFWEGMGPKDKTKAAPEGALLARIEADFGSLGAFKAQFSQAAATVEGNGWACLAWSPHFGRLYTEAVLNHQNSLVAGSAPLLVCDVWEHAYYLKYQNRRADFVAAWWNLVDWAGVEGRFARAVAWTP